MWHFFADLSPPDVSVATQYFTITTLYRQKSPKLWNLETQILLISSSLGDEVSSFLS